MKLAVMQPYFFPYIGYFQLLAAVDLFLVLDDVQFIRRGWINRNRILVNGAPHYITVPVRGQGARRPITETQVAQSPWKKQLLATLHHAYARSPHFKEIYPLLQGFFECEPEESISRLATASIGFVAGLLGLTAQIELSSLRHPRGILAGQERILDICRLESADQYFNLPGGEMLYEASRFSEIDCRLRFIEPDDVPYLQLAAEFHPRLSILDMLFNIGISGVKERLV